MQGWMKCTEWIEHTKNSTLRQPITGISLLTASSQTQTTHFLTDGKNIFIHCFQPIQRLHPNFTINGITIFMAQQKQRKQIIF